VLLIRRHTFAPLIPFLFFSFGTLGSLLLLEGGAYSSEIGEYGYATGGWYRYGIYIGLSVIQYFLIFRLISPRAPVIDWSPLNERLTIYLFAGSLAFYAVPVIYYGPAVLIGLNRYEFIDLPIVQIFNIKLYIAVLSFYIGLVANKPGSPYRRKAKILFSLTIIVMVMYGEKFSGPIAAYISYYSGKLMAEKNGYINFRQICKVALALFIFLAGIYFLWGALSGFGADLIATAFIDRASRQGQAWWKLDEMANLLGGANGKSVIDNLLYYSYSESNPLGNKYVMSMIMPSDLYNMHSGSFAAVYPAILYLNNNYITFLFYALAMNALYWVGQIIVYFYSYRGFIIYALPATCAWYAVNLKIFQSGNVYLITHINYIIGLIFFAVIILSARVKRLERKSKATQALEL
jgi:hypothetical protein